jgi:UDP-3-O-[3-hydroxymyristoyl] glucosamine N-acyltransferase
MPSINELLVLYHDGEEGSSVMYSPDAYRYSNKVELLNVTSLDRAVEGDITFCSLQGDEGVRAILQSKASYIFCHKGLNTEPPLTDMVAKAKRKILMFVENPRLTFLRMIDRYFNQVTLDIGLEDGPSDIHKTVKMFGRVRIGRGCVIDPYVSIGLPGFGYERNDLGVWEMFPHIGGVVIGANVHIGANSCVDRATLPYEATVIKRGCKLDNFVHVAHNVKMGEDVMVVSHCNIGGSVEIGDGSYLAMSVTIKNKIKIGRRCILGNRANIRKNVPDESVVVGEDQIIGHVDEKEDWRRLVGV